MNDEAEGCKDRTWEWASADTALDGQGASQHGSTKAKIWSMRGCTLGMSGGVELLVEEAVPVSW